ncbi:unnamed protein product [Ostreobium quekettii]|uniref:HMG box domain-containing protein n=1 Tax=Ostreobium quekettii TaxID=121088 RepID=A0A8S1IQR6_9CHLO|nr:unnamed protein product [Ostreobium quekettii]|eukprot:evm.model.scf_565.2 EVM.evm.TU.scf_565.2   scf_565:5555-6277(-)
MTPPFRRSLGCLTGALRRAGTPGALQPGAIARPLAATADDETKRKDPVDAVATPDAAPVAEAAGSGGKSAPKRIKRPLSAYSLYVKHAYPALKEAKPGIEPHDATKMIGKMWKRLPEKERVQFQKESNRLRAMAAAEREATTLKTADGTETTETEETTQTSEKGKAEGPKKPMSAYMVYSVQLYPSMRARFPEDKPVDLTRRIGEMWRHMGETEKRVRLRKAERAMQAYVEGQRGEVGKD